MQTRRLVPLFLAASSWCFASAIANPALTGLTVTNLGSPASPEGAYYYTALDFLNDSTLLLAVGNPAGESQTETIYSMAVGRDSSGVITSLGAATPDFSVTVSTGAVYSNIVAGGLTDAPDGSILYDTKSLGYVGDYAGGTSEVSAMAGLFGGLGYVPADGSDQLLLSTTAGTWYDLTYAGGAVSLGTGFNLGIAADSFAYFPAGFNSGLTNAGILVGDAAAQAIELYALNPATGLPTGTGINLVTAPSSGPEGLGYGLARDPVSGDFLFTGSNNEIYLLGGASLEAATTTPEPGTFALLALAGGLWAMGKLRRERQPRGER